MLKRIRVADLRLGMYIQEFCGSWMEHPFWRSSFALQDPGDLRRILESGIQEVWIDPAKGLDVAAGTSEAEVLQQVDAVLQQAEAAPAPVEHATLQAEMARARTICRQAHAAVVSMFNEVRMGQAVNHVAAEQLVADIYASVARNPGALISIARLKAADDYTYMHSVAVCGLMIALARQLGLDEQATHEAGMAGLLHDLGKAFTPAAILNKPGKLTDDEFRVMRDHPVKGHQVLTEGGAAGDVALDVCLHHHEKIDGSGYPHRLRGDQISLFAKMGAVCDVYDAITSDRPYKAGWQPAEAVRKMAEWSTGHFDSRTFQAFVKTIGIYPIGSLVGLESGRLGVVLEQSERSLLVPRVLVFYSTRAGAYLPPEELDLARPGCQDRITGYEAADKWGVRPPAVVTPA